MNRLHRWRAHVRTSLLALAVAAAAPAQPIIIGIDAPHANPPISLQLAGASISDLVNQVLAREGELSGLEGTSFNASVNYLGVPSAINLVIAADGTSATLDLPLIDFSQTFTAGSIERLQAQLEAFIRESGSGQLAALRQEMNKRSVAGLTDGNPNATTAQFAEVFWRGHGLAFNRANPAPDGATPYRFDVRLRGGEWRAENLRAWRAQTDLEFAWQARPNLALTALAPLSVDEMDGARIYGAGLGAGFTYWWLLPREDQPWEVRLSLFTGAMLRASEALAAGGALWTYGGNVAVVRDLGPHWRIGLLGQINDFEGIPLDYEGFQLDRVVDQEIVKLGVQLIADLPWTAQVELRLSQSHFLQAAALDQYHTAVVGYLWEAAGVNWMIGYESSFADRFRSHLARLRASLRF